MLGHFVSSVSGSATNTPPRSCPVTMTWRVVLNASGTEPWYETGTVTGAPSSFSTNRIGLVVPEVWTTTPVSVTFLWAAPSWSAR